MILYNVTVKIDNDFRDEWLDWMKNVHIPEVMGTGLFVEYKICRLLELDDSDGYTYAIQYFALNMSDYNRYRNEYGPSLQQKHTEKFRDKFVAFRTIMEVL
ncbi:MAG TPA: DUF4286 family protein [Flavobacterium sp.]|nr:DUF4286 family protein [Flavobacterium sp.]